MKLEKYSLIFLLLLILCSQLKAQQSSISFYVKDSILSNPLQGVEVYDSKIGFLAKSDENGIIEINLSTENSLIILFSFGYNILELDTYFTSGPEETRAWTIQKNCTAPKAAGEIHTDFEKGFIRAETVAYEDFIANEGWLNSKTNGKMRLEGKDYITISF